MPKKKTRKSYGTFTPATIRRKSKQNAINLDFPSPDNPWMHSGVALLDSLDARMSLLEAEHARKDWSARAPPRPKVGLGEDCRESDDCLGYPDKEIRCGHRGTTKRFKNLGVKGTKKCRVATKRQINADIKKAKELQRISKRGFNPRGLNFLNPWG